MIDWGEYKNTIFIFDYETKELLFTFDEDNKPYYISTGGVLGMVMPDSVCEEYPYGRKITVVRAYRFDDDYYEKFEPGHKAPKLVQRCWRMLQLNRLDQ